MFTCYCGQSFGLPGPLVDHKKAERHGYCHLCKEFFVSDEVLKAHFIAFHTVFCSVCKKGFSDTTSLKNHQESTGHCYCKVCKRHFVNSDAIRQHQNSSIHANSGNSKRRRGRRKKHKSIAHRCDKCGKTFPETHALQQHLDAAHRKLEKIMCVASSKCTALFSSPSALLQHLESGRCPSGINKKVFNKLVQLKDIRSIIESCFTEKDIAVATNGGLSMKPKTNTSLMTSLPNRNDTLIDTSTMDEDLGVQLATALDERLTLGSTPNLSTPRILFPTITDDEELKLLSKKFPRMSGFVQHVENGSYRCKDAVLKKAIGFLQKRLIEAGF